MNRLIVPLILAAVALPQLAHARDRADQRQYDQRHSGQQVLRCESVDQRDQYCPADTRQGVRLVRQESRADCVLGRTWGYDRRGIWVTRGCRARFELGGRYQGQPGYGRDPDYARGRGNAYGQGRGRALRCESHDERPNFCRVQGGIRDAEITRRLSRAGCEYGQSWGFRRDGVWVDRGCRADFVVF